MTARVLLVDDHAMMRDGLRAVLEREALQVVGEASNGHEAIEAARRCHPDVVVMDISMPELNGVDATRRVITDVPGVKVIALSMNSDRHYVLAMFRAGAVGYLLKSAASSELIQAVRAVASGHKYVSPSVAGVVLDTVVERLVAQAPGPPGPSASLRPLTQREREVLQLLAEGKSSKEIASRLGVAVATVETHRRQIMAKLDIRTIAELTKYAIREGLTSTD